MSQKSRYKQVCKEHQLPLFFQPWWLDMTGMKWDVVVVEGKDGVEAVWPYTIENKAGVTITRNPLLTPYLGPYFLLNEQDESKRLGKEDKVYEQFWKQMPKWQFFDVQCFPGYNNFLPFHHKGFEYRQRITYHVDLTKEESEILAGIESRKRTYIRNAEKSLAIVDGLPYVKQFYQYHKETLSRKGEKYPYEESYFEKLISTSISHHAGLLQAVIDEEKNVHALLFTVYDNEQMYLLISATNPHIDTHNGALSLLIWDAIKKAKSMGLRIFDFEGSMDKGVEKFFRSFGGKRTFYLSCTSNKSTLWKIKRALLG